MVTSASPSNLFARQSRKTPKALFPGIKTVHPTEELRCTTRRRQCPPLLRKIQLRTCRQVSKGSARGVLRLGAIAGVIWQSREALLSDPLQALLWLTETPFGSVGRNQKLLTEGAEPNTSVRNHRSVAVS